MTASSHTLTTRFAEAILSADPLADSAAVTAARTAIIDYLACAIAGAGDRTTEILRTALGGSTSGKAVLIGRRGGSDPLTAAVINGYAGHVLDYDDVHASVRGHPTAVIIPALLAFAAEHELRADAFLSAYIVGLEAMARLGLSIGVKHYENGFHATATLGTMGAAAALSSLTRASVKETAVALGLAATQSTGLRLQFGYDAKPYHAGMAARAGLLAKRLAAAGFGGACDFLDNPVGFYSAFAFGAAQPPLVVENWGTPWQIVSPGLTLKAYPCCTASHPVAAIGVDLHREGTAADMVEQVTFTFPPGADAALAVTHPNTGIEARFSPEYVFAAALTDGALRLDHFDDRPVQPGLLALSAKARRRHDDSAPRMSSDPKTRFVVVDVTLRDGSTLSRRFDGLPGVTDATTKFRDATADNAAFSEIPTLVRSMTTSADLQRLLQLLGQNAD
ncbi:MmgE/PrpD family protein [Rhizobium sp. HT1-10]|uniref:MmgE/PrpD family protein n=1 Tax=Rhizobium sp. HT1-10 TaxID=3111638 RepID=UPI003C1AECD3